MSTTTRPLVPGELKFPRGFLWGASTSAHQIEGNNHNDWSEWELENAERLAQAAPRKYAHWLPAWERIKSQATNPQNYISGKAAEHYTRYETDFDLIEELGLNTYRLSLEWSRIEPQKGEFDHEAIAHYREMIASLQKRGIQPFVTLWHWTLPTWVSDIGGWQNMETVKYFSRYVYKMVSELPEVSNWVTLNEAEIYTRQAYLEGDWPPQKRTYIHYWMINNNLMAAHKEAYKHVKMVNPEAQVGIVQNNTYFEPIRNRWFNRLLASFLSWWHNRFLLNTIQDHLDFIGVNYYFHNTVNLAKDFKPHCDRSDMGWDLCTYGIYYVLKELQRYGKPVYVTENGLADAGDVYRAGFIKETLNYVHQAIAEGVDVRGYFHWSLLDNFEWDKGFWPRFGLVAVDYATQERTIRPSAKIYAKIAKSNSL